MSDPRGACLHLSFQFSQVCSFVRKFVSLEENGVPSHSLSLRSPKFQRDTQPLWTKNHTTSWGNKSHPNSWDKKIMQPLNTKINHATSGDNKKITQPLVTKKIMQQIGTKKKSHKRWGQKKPSNLSGQKKITQPSTTKKNHATSWGRKSYIILRLKKSCNLLGPKKLSNLSIFKKIFTQSLMTKKKHNLLEQKQFTHHLGTIKKSHNLLGQ